MAFWNSKTTQEIEERARKKERAICEKELIEQKRISEKINIDHERLYRDNLYQQKKDHEDDIKRLEYDLKSKFDAIIKESEKKHEEEIKKLKAIIIEKDSHMKDIRNAWKYIWEIVPEMCNVTSMVRSRMKIKKMEVVNEYQTTAKIDDNSQHLFDKIDKINSHMEELLCISKQDLLEGE